MLLTPRLRLLACALPFLLASLPAAADDDNAAMPETLVIGYDEEGKVDPSAAACRAFVEETVEWDKAEMDQAVRDVCAHRRRHADAYEALQSAYVGFRGVLQDQPRFDGPAAARNIAASSKAASTSNGRSPPAATTSAWT